MIIDDFFTWMGCKIFGHKYYVIEEFYPGERKIGCVCCEKQWTMNDRLQTLLPWDQEFEYLYCDFPELLCRWAERRKNNKIKNPIDMKEELMKSASAEMNCEINREQKKKGL